MYRHPDDHLCYKDSVHKDWVIEIVDEESEEPIIIDNSLLVQDEIEITDTLCSKDDITLGCCESVTFEFKVLNDGTTFKDKTLNVSIVLDNHTTTPIPIGVFKVDEDELEDDQRFRKIKAYDALYTINNKDFAPWFNNLPANQAITCKDFRDSFFEYAGIEQESVNLINDWIPFTFQVTNSGATQRMLDEETEKINQLIDNANNGTEVITYELVDPANYQYWDKKEVRTYDPYYKWEPVYTLVQNPTGNPKRKGYYEFTDAGYILTKDTSVKEGKNYYTIDSPENIDPSELGLFEVDGDDFKTTEDTTPKKNKQYYEELLEEIQSPYDYGWYEHFISGYAPSYDTEIVEGRNYYVAVNTVPEKPKYVKVVTFHEGDNPSEKNWYEYDDQTDEYSKTTDTTVTPNKDYFEKVIPQNKNTAFICLTPYIDSHRLDNPKEKGWYELVNDAYVKTEDTEIDRTKDYYENIWEINQNEEKDIVEDQIMGSEIIQAICEINGCFGHIGRDGKFKYIKLKPIDFDDEGLYPEPELYPDPTLYPQGQPYDELIQRGVYEEIERKDYYVKKIDRLVICKEDGDAGYVYPADSIPDDHNTYKITGNFIWYSFTGSKETLDLAGQNLLLDGVAQISEYTPCEIDMMGNPCLEVGDTLKVQTRLGTFYTYVLQRTLSGSQRLTDTIEVNGSKERTTENTLYDAVITLQGKSNILKRSIDETRSEIIDVSESLSSLIKQTADSITLSVSREVKNLEDKTNEKYKSSTEYTDSMIKNTVSKEVYDDNNNKLSEMFSEIKQEAYQITATVEQKLDSEGTGEGFKWELTSNGFRLKSLGGYTLVQHPTGNPNQQGWYEINSETQQYELTDDTTVEEGKSYYIASTSSDYQDVFVCTRNGVWVKNAVTVDYLNVELEAVITRLVADELVVTRTANLATATADDLTATKANIPTLVSQQISTANLNASNITAGKLNAVYIDADSLKSKIIDAVSIIATPTAPNQGTMQIGEIRCAKYYYYHNTSGSATGGTYKPMTVRKFVDNQGTEYNVLCFL